MFKELGEFIDHVGNATGYFIKKIFSEDNDDDVTGYPAYHHDETRTQITIKDIDKK